MSNKSTLMAIVFISHLMSCNSGSSTKSEAVLKVSTPVTVMTAGNKPISEIISFNAVSTYQRKNIVKSTTTGFVFKSFVNQGDIVKSGNPLYVIITKEGDALSEFSKKDTLLSFKGKFTIVAPTSGVVVEATRQTNDYINDGEQLCVLAERSSFIFLLNVPFEQNKYAATGTRCSILLPDSTILNGVIAGKLSTVDPVSQTQSFIVKPENTGMLPENLSVIVRIIKRSNVNAQVIDKSCVLSDEAMEKFWVMKLINDTTAIKTMIKPGIKSARQIEILSPIFTLRDRIITSGNYGLPDTATVNIIQH
jgi:biotin carboxyl carrier protein